MFSDRRAAVAATLCCPQAGCLAADPRGGYAGVLANSTHDAGVNRTDPGVERAKTARGLWQIGGDSSSATTPSAAVASGSAIQWAVIGAPR